MEQVSASAISAKQQMASRFFRKGVFLATLSGISYGLYTAFITLAMSVGIWEDWYGPNLAGLTMFTIVYVIGALGSSLNYTLSAVWGAGIAGARGKLRDFFKSVNSKPGRMMVLAALVGGPISSTAYIVGLQLAGSIVIPIAALCPAIGAILGRLFYKQKLNLRMLFGISICVFASFLIGLQSVAPDAPPQMLMGILIAFIAAVGWGFEGCVAGYGTSMIDYEVGILIRQSVSGIVGLFILVPVFAIMAGDMGLSVSLLGDALSSTNAMLIFFVSSFFTLYAFSLWYKGNAMCGTALGMACNGTFSFWGPLFCWIILGVFVGQEGWNLPFVAWVAAVLMSVGILFIAVNPLKLIEKRGAV
ncbi:MAG: hypothetical protein FWG63_09035 [Defluviitaleaceae bacterium]|nr:hypothetical protein [Defluviitaleaceae bacterium]